MVAAVADAIDAHPLAGDGGESLHHLRRDRLLQRTVEHGLRPLGIDLGLIAERAQPLDAVFEGRIVSAARMVMAPPHLVPWQMPVRSAGPLTTRAGMTMAPRVSAAIMRWNSGRRSLVADAPASTWVSASL